jgi:hypothetical protein
MYQFEDLFIKISNDFHTEINPILEQINSESKQSVWFERKSISGKFFIVKGLLLSLTASESKQYQLMQLINILEIYKIRLTEYFNSNNIATCFVYNSVPENINKTKHYFESLLDYSVSYQFSLEIGYCFMIGLGMIGFPNDCSYKFEAKLINNEIAINEQYDPFPWNIGKGKIIGSPLKTRQEQIEIENELYKKEHDLLTKGEKLNLQKFTDFAKNTHLKIIALLEDFNTCANLCKSIIEKKQKDSTPANLPEIERIHSVLINGYIMEPFERFLAVFQSGYSDEKLTWLKTGTELKFFIDRLNEKLDLSNEINKWAGQRFELLKPVKNMTGYLSKQTSKDEYQLLIQGNLRKNPLYKLFRE